MCVCIVAAREQANAWLVTLSAAQQFKQNRSINKSPQPNMPLEHKQYQPITTSSFLAQGTSTIRA